MKSAFRQVGVDPAGAVNFGYVLGDHLFINPRLQFGWRGSPGWWGVLANAIQQAQRQTTRASVTILDARVAVTAHVRVAEDTGVKAEPLPKGFTVQAVERGSRGHRVGDFLYGRCGVGGIQWEPDGGG